MMLPLQSMSSILLASSFLFNGAQGKRDKKEIIGYRTVPDAEAKLFNENQKPYRDKKYDGEEFRPYLSTGFYMSNKPTRWRAEDDGSYCVIKADKKRLKGISKVWIPKENPNTDEQETQQETRPFEPLWYVNEEALLEYIGSKVPGNPEKALRFSSVIGNEEELQMAIPTDIVNDDELDLWTQCWKTERELRKFKTVDWMNWDIIGKPGSEDKKGWYRSMLDRWRSPTAPAPES